jgi:hypothetical protein
MAAQGQRGQSSPQQRNEGQAGKTGADPAHQNPACEQPGAGNVSATMRNKAQEAASAVGATAGQAWDNLKQGAQSAASTLAGTGEDAWEEITHFVRRYPVATFAAGVGVGSFGGVDGARPFPVRVPEPGLAQPFFPVHHV